MKKKNEVIDLNEEQEAAVNAIDGCYAVVAGAGTGKTTVLIQRYLKMLLSGIPSKDILNLTFTSSAAREMQNRAGPLDVSTFRTFHSFALDLLQKERKHLPFELCETIIPVELQDFQLLFDLVKVYPGINWRTLQEKISGWKCKSIRPDQAIDEAINNGVEFFYASAYRDYETKSRDQGWLDFDNLIVETVNLLKTNEEVRNRWKKKYICVDEAQDTSENQFELLKLIFEKHVFFVGDEAQLIFAWRDAKEGNLSNLAKEFPGTQTLFLGVNHRSTKLLVDFFREILPVDNGLALRMTTYNPDGEAPVITKYRDQEEEADQVLKKIEDPLTSAVIARTNRQLFMFQKKCAMKGLKYNYLGKKDFWDQSEVKKVLKLAKDVNDDRPASVVLSDIIQRHNLINLYSQGGINPMESNPIENLNDLVKISKGKGNTKKFLDYLRRLTHARKSLKGVTLSTVHMAKGKEFDHVFLVGVKQGLLPHKDSDDLAEESRLFYVGSSRVAKSLNISFFDSPSQFLNNYRDKIVSFQEAECPTSI